VPFVTDADVKQKRARIAAEWSAIAAAASHSADRLTPSQQATMGTLASRFETMGTDAPSFFRAAAQSDEADSFEKDLQAWADDLRASGIPGVPARAAAAPTGIVDKLLELAPMILIGLGVLKMGKGSK
jgi:hypothetical protein